MIDDETMNVNIEETGVVFTEAVIVAKVLLDKIDFAEYAPPYVVRKVSDDEAPMAVHAGLWAVYLRDNTKLDTNNFRLETLRAMTHLAVPTMLRQLCQNRLDVLDDGTHYDDEREELYKIITYIDGLPWKDNIVFEREDDGSISVLLDDKPYTIKKVSTLP